MTRRLLGLGVGQGIVGSSMMMTLASNDSALRLHHLLLADG